MEYEGVDFFVSKNSSIERNLMKLSIKKKIGRLIGKPYRKDPYLLFSEEILKRIPKACIVDVGANIGTTVFPLARQFSKARFIAVEPHPLPAARFIQNCQLNHLSNVVLVNAAISPKSELVKIYTCPSNSGGHRITGFEGRQDVKPSTLDQVSVLSISLNSVFSCFSINYCDILKIDVEGFECQVLESLENLLTPSKFGAIIAEYGPEGLKKAGKTGWEMVKMMLNKGFQCHELSTQKPIRSEQEIPAVLDCAVTDFVFLPV